MGQPTAADYEEYIADLHVKAREMELLQEENKALRELVQHLMRVDKEDGALGSILPGWGLSRHKAADCEICTRAASYLNPTADVSWWRW
ncbi:MAG: hypothetical protein GY769_07755 [bacterium]|nr:hypothetical protein [bacterium]